MSAETYLTTDPETVKLWSKKLWREHRKSDAIFDPDNGLVGNDPLVYPFVVQDELGKGPGDRLRAPYIFQLTGRGVIGDAQLEGQEEAINTTTFDLTIEEQVHGVHTRGKMVHQRVTFDTLEEGKRGLKDWWRRRRAVEAVNHLAGYTLQTDLAYTALNTVNTPDAQHIYRIGAGLGLSDDQTVGANTAAVFDVDIVEELVAIAETLTPAIPPFQWKGNPYYGMLLHTDTIADIRATNSTWYDQMKSALQGGDFKSNPIFTRALGVHGNVVFFRCPQIPRGIHSSGLTPVNTARRNVFFGAGALQLGYGRYNPGEKDHFMWYSGTWDHGRKYHASAGMIHGMKGIAFSVDGTVRDHGKIVVVSYANPRVASAKDLDQKLPSGL